MKCDFTLTNEQRALVERVPVTIAVANLYLRKQIVFERV